MIGAVFCDGCGKPLDPNDDSIWTETGGALCEGCRPTSEPETSVTWADIFPRVKDVGESEYAAIADCAAQALLEVEEWMADPDTPLPAHALDHLEGILTQFERWARSLLTKTRKAQKDAQVSELVQLVKWRRLSSVDLDELVHDAKGDEAAEINNGGVESQIRYLVEVNGAGAVKDWVMSIPPDIAEGEEHGQARD
jgi:hypothetical protein